jgi:hypothetical protein
VSVVTLLMTARWAWDQRRRCHLVCHPRCFSAVAVCSKVDYTAGLSTETRIPPRLPPRLLLMPAVSSLMVASCAWEQKQWYNLNCHSSCSSISAVSYTIKCTSRLRTETRIPPPLPPEMLLALRCCYHPGQAMPLPKSSAGTSFSARQAWTRTSCCLFQ